MSSHLNAIWGYSVRNATKTSSLRHFLDISIQNIYHVANPCLFSRDLLVSKGQQNSSGEGSIR